ncbi:MAG TPA: 3-methyl-2-oxobutanoate hydroxymethyltransferase [Burkholderiaceae bacterium]
MSAHTSPSAAASGRTAITLPRLREMRARGEKIAVLTCYDATFAEVLDGAGVDVLLVGDSLGNVVQGRRNTLAVTLEDIAYHTACVARAEPAAWLVADLPFGSYEAGKAAALDASVALMRAGARMVKLEGGDWTAEIVEHLVSRGIPVCAHLGFTPQRVHALGGYRVQGRDDAAAAQLRADARALSEAGAAMLVLEMVPSAVGAAVTADNPDLLTIGIGAGGEVSGQVLVLHDMLGLGAGRKPRFVRDFTAEGGSIAAAVGRYVAAVKDGSYPREGVHTY